MLMLPAVASGKPTLNTVHNCNALTLLKALPDESVNCIITSPPYFGLRSYLPNGDPNKHLEIGLEDTPRAFVDRLVTVFAEARRVLRSDGVFFVNMGDSYAGSGAGGVAPIGETGQRKGRGNDGAQYSTGSIQGLPSKSRLGIPHRLVFALQDDGWIWRDEIIWAKPNPMPESVTDRTTKAHEFVFMLTKEPRYWYDNAAIRESQVVDNQKEALKRSGRYGAGYDKWNDANGFRGAGGLGQNVTFNPLGRNKRSIWTIPTEPTPFAHFATFPQALIEPMILSGCPKDGVVLDPFMGSGTSAIVARRLGRNYIGSELNPEYAALANNRLLKTDAVILVEQKTGVSQMSMFEVTS